MLKFQHVVDDKKFKRKPIERVDLLGKGILEIPSAKFMR